MSGLPDAIAADIAFHLDAIKAHFKSPKVTLVIRPTVAPGLDADVLITDDDPLEAIKAITRRVTTPEEG